MSNPLKPILVTGANKGIGLALVAALLESDDSIFVLLGSRDLARGEAARDGLLDKHPSWAGRLCVIALDVSDDVSVNIAATEIASMYPDDTKPLYAVVNNAGIGADAGDIRMVMNVNLYGVRRVCERFIPMLDNNSGRIVNVASASGPMFLADCSPGIRDALTSPDVTWTDIEWTINQCLAIEAKGGDFAAQGFGSGSSYGFSKACVNAYTIDLARSNPRLRINACTPGYIETDMTRPFAEGTGRSPAEMGMKPVWEATKAPLHLLFGDVGTGWYYGSDGVRSPLDRYRGPGEPAYDGS